MRGVGRHRGEILDQRRFHRGLVGRQKHPVLEEKIGALEHNDVEEGFQQSGPQQHPLTPHVHVAKLIILPRGIAYIEVHPLVEPMEVEEHREVQILVGPHYHTGSSLFAEAPQPLYDPQIGLTLEMDEVGFVFPFASEQQSGTRRFFKVHDQLYRMDPRILLESTQEKTVHLNSETAVPHQPSHVNPLGRTRNAWIVEIARGDESSGLQHHIGSVG